MKCANGDFTDYVCVFVFACTLLKQFQMAVNIAVCDLNMYRALYKPCLAAT